MTDGKPSPKRPRGRPEKRIIKLDATPEEAARAIFSAAEKPDPSLRKKGDGQTKKRG